MIAYLHFFNHYMVASMAFYLLNCKQQLDEVCHNHTPSKHTSISTSQIIFADDNFTYIDCNGMIFEDALGLTVANYPESCNWPTSNMLCRHSTVVVSN